MKDNYSKRERVSRMRHFVACVLMLFGAGLSTAFAQSYISGTVTDAQGNPLVGVNVIVKGTTVGTMTTSDGSYRLDTPPRADVLIFSYLGMKGQELAINGRTEINVVMQEDAARMDEVVVVGYGTQKKVHLTGSIAAVSDDEIKKSTVSTISQALVGKLPGLITQQATGAPGSDGVTMLVRGYTSYNGSSPLVLVDGVERQMGTVDPNDVETVTILKDASASAVYGMKAAAGVILITTKRGHQGAMSINYRGNVTLSQMTTMPDFMNGTQYMEYYNAGLALDKLGGDDVPDYQFTPEEIAMTYNGDPSDGYENTDWMSPMRRLTLMHQHNLSVSGGSEKARYFVSGGFRNQEGIIKGHEDSRGNLRSNVDLTPHDNLRVQLNVAASLQDYYQPGAYSYANQEGYNIFHQMMYSIPFVPKWLEKDGTVYPVSGYRASWSAASPEYGSAHSGFSKSRNLRLETSANVEYSVPFVKGLKLGLFTSWDYHYYTGRTFSHSYEVLAYTFQRGSDIGADPLSKYSLVNAANLTPDGNLYVAHSNDQRVVLRPQISYANKFGKHDVGALFLYEQKKGYSDTMTGRKNGYYADYPVDLSLGSTWEGIDVPVSGSFSDTGIASFAGRISYAYDRKYLAEFTFRADGSYKFAPHNRWGFFPSVALGWVVSEENFFKKALPKVDFLKLRASYGELGADDTSAWLYMQSYSTTAPSFSYIVGGTGHTAYYTSNYVYDNLTWSRTHSFNVGFDLSVWEGKLGVEFDWFYKLTDHILEQVAGSYAPSLGGNVPSYMNSGKMDNRGFELVLKHNNHFSSGWRYSLTGSLSWARNKVLAKHISDDHPMYRAILGQPIGSIYGFKATGLFQTEEQIANAPTAPSGEKRLGDLMYADINGDGKIDSSKDFVKIGRSYTPEMNFSLNMEVAYKNLYLTALWQGAALCSYQLSAAYNSGVFDNTMYTRPFYSSGNAPYYLVEGAWREDNRDAEYPRLSTVANGNNAWPSSWWVKNGAYLRLKNLQIGYTLPQHLLNKTGIERVNIYIAGTNLLTFSAFKYVDPEMPSVNNGYYPQQRTYSIGVNLSF